MKAEAVAGESGRASLAGSLVFARPDLTVRPVSAADDTFCRALFHEDRAPDFAPLRLEPATLATLLDQQFRAQQIGYRSTAPDAEHFVIDLAGRAIGRLITSLVAAGEGRELRLMSIVLSASSRGRGIGTDIIESLGRAARTQGATRMVLSVLRSNDGARRLYERLGFRATADSETGSHVAMAKPLA